MLRIVFLLGFLLFASLGLAFMSSSVVMPYLSAISSYFSPRPTLCVVRIAGMVSFFSAGVALAVSLALALPAGMSITSPVRKLFIDSPGLAWHISNGVTLYIFPNL